jgi:hypothetical protein
VCVRLLVCVSCVFVSMFGVRVCVLRACVLLHERAHQQQLCVHGVCRQGPARAADELRPRRAGGPGRA